MTNISFDENLFTFKQAYEADTELNQYGSNSLSLFALSLYLRLEDVGEFAAGSITEGPNDKKIDVCYVDEVENRVIIVQSYFSSTWGKTAAPSNKASDLNTAIAWLLSASEDRVPQHLKTKAKEIRSALADDSIKKIEILYIHNCFESQNVQDELKAVADAARDITSSLVASRNGQLVVAYRELGLKGIEELYKSRDSDILIDSMIDVPISGFVEESCNEWKAILTTVSGEWVRSLYKKYGDRLFSANYRDYLSYVKRPGNINYQITQTADSEPVNFWVYNNGITALTHELLANENGKDLRVRGISIINGAQTTGSLGDATEPGALQTKVLIRIVECRSKGLVDKIIRFNNTQNEIKPADRRSNDSIQRRLQADFSQYGITYLHRRTGARSPRNAITAAAIAPALCAFHGDSQTSYRNASEIFNNDNTYQSVFSSNITSEHVFLVKALSTAIDSVKTDLKRKVSDESATQMEAQQYDALKYSASKHFLFYLIGTIAEEVMGRRVSDLFNWKCRREVVSANNVSMSKAWDVALRALLPLVVTVVEKRGKDATYDVPRSAEMSKQVAAELKALVASYESVLGSQFDEVRTRTII